MIVKDLIEVLKGFHLESIVFIYDPNTEKMEEVTGAVGDAYEIELMSDLP